MVVKMFPFRTVITLLLINVLSCTYGFNNYVGLNAGPLPTNYKGEPLFLTPLIENGEIEKAKTLSEVKSLVDSADVKSYSGYITVNKTYNSNLFFWFFLSEIKPEVAPIIVWLQGGPGASSLYGLFTENGPYYVTDRLEVLLRPYRWNRLSGIIYIDNPTGTGYSFTDSEDGYSRTEEQVGANLYETMRQFYLLFPELQKNELYVVGESYGGKYAPALAYTIHQENKKSDSKMNLQGVALGDGFSDPIHMLNFADYLYELGFIDLNARAEFATFRTETMKLIEDGKYLEAYNKWNVLLNNDLSNSTSLFTNLTGFTNYYNYLYPTVPSSNSMNTFVQQDSVRDAIHVGNKTYNIENGDVEKYLLNDMMRSVANWVEELVEHYRVLIYNGQLDIIVAYPLTLEYLQNLKWSGAEEYKTKNRCIWRIKNKIAGYSKTVKNLQEVLVRNAGHMVPGDQPLFAFDLIYRWMYGKQFGTC